MHGPSPLVVPRLVLQGTILIAVNPLQKVADPEMSDFMNRSLDPEAPHPYAIAEVCTYEQYVHRFKV